jgi:DNA-binding MarR family transcriptional regulator
LEKEIEWGKFIKDLQAVHKAIQQNIDKEISKGRLTAPQLMVLDELVNCNGLTLKELSQKVRLTHSTVSGIIDRLEKQELVERKTDESDRRYTRLYITEQVRDYIEKMIPEYYVPLLTKVKEATKEEQLVIIRGISKLRNLITKERA